MVIFGLIRALEVVELSLDLHHVGVSHGGDKSNKNNLLIDDWHDHNLDRDFYSFNTDVSLLRVAYFNDYLNDLIGDIGIDLVAALAVFV